MATTVSQWSDVDEAAREAAGNWQKFESFAWHDKPADAAHWCIVYTHNRDSDVLTRSNAEAIHKEMSGFITGRDNASVRAEDHNHWACGWVKGYAIKVYTKSGKVTVAFRKWCELQARLADYPVLDEEAHSRMEYEECLETIKACGRGTVLEALDDDYWPGRVYRELNVNHPDDVREDDVRKKLAEFGFLQPDEMPKDPFPAHVGRVVKMRLGNMTEEQVREALTEVVTTLLDGNGRPTVQVEEVENVLKQYELWPTD